jgi:hypothetical protein
MVAELRNRFRASFIMSDAPMPITSVSELLADVQSRPVWDGASISPADADYPRMHLDWHKGHGFVFQCHDDEELWSDFLVTSRQFSTPSVEVELGGQALERWAPELFVSAEHATQALNHFLGHGKQDPALKWIRIDSFPRETLWEGREQLRAIGRPRLAVRPPGVRPPALRAALQCARRAPRPVRVIPSRRERQRNR